MKKENLYILISNIYTKGLAYLYYFLVAFFFNTEGFGIVRALMPILDTLTIFFSSGIPPSIAKFTAEGKKVNISILLVMIILSLIGFFLVITIKYILGGYYLNLSDSLFYVLGLCILLSTIIAFVRGILQGTFKFGYLSLSWILESSLKVLFLIIFSFIGVIGAFLSIALSYLTVGIFFFNFVRNAIEYSLNFKYCLDILKYSIPIALTSSSFRLFGDIDNIIIMIFLGSFWSGVYGYSSLLSRGIFIVASAISIPLLPKIAKTKNLDLLKKGLIYNTIISLPIIIVFLLFPDIILYFFFKIKNSEGILALRILSISSLFLSYFSIVSSALQGLGFAKYSLCSVLFGIIINIFLNIIMIKSYGIVGASLATLISSLFTFVLSYIILKIKT
ncbi:flippase [Methanocaldococcus indicus]|uniref:flippase n=1 Tax=Methanocaldococcus indicus TaxID=213231 RepID=UPI003C6CD107